MSLFLLLLLLLLSSLLVLFLFVRLRRSLDFLHPTRIVTGGDYEWLGPLLPLFNFGKRCVVWLLYEYISFAFRLPQFTVMNYGFASPFSSDGRLGLSRAKEEEKRGDGDGDVDGLEETYCLQMYLFCLLSDIFPSSFELPIEELRQHLKDKRVVEIGSGRGGGAAYLAKTFPSIKEMLGVELASTAVEFSKKRFSSIERLKFVQGNAEDLSPVLASSSVDLVLNIESQHCYASLSSFAQEIGRVLRPGGRFHFVGFVSSEKVDWLESVFKLDGNLTLMSKRDITPNVVKSLELDEQRKMRLLRLIAPSEWLISFARGFIGVKGTAMRTAFENGQTKYINFVFQKC